MVLWQISLDKFRVHSFGLFLFRFRNNRIHGISISKRTLLDRPRSGNGIPMADRGERPRRISRQKFSKRTRILSIPSKPYSFNSVHSGIGSRMNGMIFRSFRKRNSSQKNTNDVYSEYSYSGIVPKERALRRNVLTKFGYLVPSQDAQNVYAIAKGATVLK